MLADSSHRRFSSYSIQCFEQFLGGLFNFGGDDKKNGPVKSLRSEPTEQVEGTYRAPEIRQMGRPHMLGWLEKLETPEEDQMKLGQVPAGRIIVED